MNVGITLADGVLETFNDLKIKKAYQYLILRTSDDYTQIIVDVKGERGTTYDDMLKNLPADKPRYIIYDYQLTTADGRNISKLVCVKYAPDAAKIKDKLTAASAIKEVETKLQGLSPTIQASDFSDFDEAEIIKRYSK